VGGKELLDLVGERIFSEEEGGLLAHANTTWPDNGPYFNEL
jgi:hypothetical protein